MIYLKFKHPESQFMAFSTDNVRDISFLHRYMAGEIIKFTHGKTVYLKDVTGMNYQYTGEEQVLITLKSMS